MAEAHVYAISAGAQAVKLGAAVDPESALAALRNVFPLHIAEGLRLAFTMECRSEEEAVNAATLACRSLDKHRLPAAQWFRVSDATAKQTLLDAINLVKVSQAVAQVRKKRKLSPAA